MTAAIHTVGLTKRYGHVTDLDSLDLEVEQGEVFGYLGPNGAGKSTTLALLLGLIRPTSGEARIFDLDVRRDATAVHRRLAYVPSEANLWPSLTGEEALQFLGNVHGSVDETYRAELECDVTGPVLRVLTDAGVTRLTTREPSLEELFLAHYGDPAA